MKIKTLAQLAGVSPSTVSKAFSGSHEVSEATREHIFAVAREHGVFEKFDKNKFSKRIIAVICPTVRRDYYQEILTVMKNEIEARGCMMLVSISDFSADKRAELYSYYTAYAKVDGVIVLSHTLDDVDPETLMIPTLLYTKNPAYALNLDTVFLDVRPALVDALNDLKSRGHERIGFAADSMKNPRVPMFRDAMRQVGLTLRAEDIKTSSTLHEELTLREDDIRTSSQRMAGAGMQIINEWITEGDVPSAIIAASDYIAIGMFKLLSEKGYRVPEDVAIIGMDDIMQAPFLTPSLSSISFPTERACRMAVDLLMKKLNNRYYSAPDDIRLRAEYVPRESSGGPSSAP